MDIANDLMANLRSRISTGGQVVPNGTPCWAELHARLSAAHAAAGELLRQSAAAPVGGFVQWQRKGRSNPSYGVNPTNSADRKADIVIEGDTAGAIKTGGRG